VTVANNTADSDNATGGDGGGVAQLEMSTVTAAGSILAGNSDQSSAPDCFGTVGSAGYNVVGSTAGCAFAPQATDATGVDAKLAALADNGGMTMTHALGKDSPALDRRPKGDPGCGGTDQRGVPRPQRGGCDSGAYELALCQKVTVNRVGTSGNDVVTGTGAKDGILALGGKDKLKGKAGPDGLCGGPGKDTLRGGGGKDRLDGGPGKDTCVGQAGKDKAKACEKEKGIP
jgi:Ca2+-binding RTX toxin-like protein